MQKAIWNNIEYIAFEIAQDLLLEKELRKASYTNELKCPDPECNSPMIFKNGSIRIPHFSHKANRSCNYQEYDERIPSYIKEIRQKIYQELKTKGHNLSVDKKLVPKHYSLLTCETTKGVHAIEICSENTSARYIIETTEKYQENGIDFSWIVAYDTHELNLDQYSFLQKFPLVVLKKIFLANKTGCKIWQYTLHHDGKITRKRTEGCELTFTNDSLEVLGKEIEYQKIETILPQKVEIHETKQPSNKFDDINISKEKNENYSSKPLKKAFKIDTSLRLPQKTIPEAIIQNPDLTRRFIEECNNTKNIVTDSKGRRLFLCRKCKLLSKREAFVSSGGINTLNSGVCLECSRKFEYEAYL